MNTDEYGLQKAEASPEAEYDGHVELPAGEPRPHRERRRCTDCNQIRDLSDMHADDQCLACRDRWARGLPKLRRPKPDDEANYGRSTWT